jgi:hypothetical protein
MKTIKEALDANGSGIKILIPLLHKIMGAMFNEMEEGGIKTEWYRDTFASLLTFLAYEAYDNPKKDFEKYVEIVNNDYKIFEKDIAKA